MPVDANLPILVADDMPAMRAILRGMLHELGFARILEAEDGDRAWELILRGAADRADAIGLVIADWQMPGKSGLELLRSVRMTTAVARIPFFMVTAKGGEAAVREAQAAGVTDYLVKPFVAEELGARIRSLFPR
jgi:two-component system chemotaxis response regulator CheY